MSGDDDRTGPSPSAQEALARLRAADPAAEREPREDLAAQIIARAVGSRQGAAGGADQGTGGSAPPAAVDLEARRRSRRWPSVLAGAAAAAIIGVGGYAAGATGVFHGGGSHAADSTGAPESAEGSSEESAEDSAPEGLAADESEAAALSGHDPLAQSVPESASAPADSALYPAGPGRTTFIASGLGAGTGQAAGYALDPNAEPARDVAARAADVFGLAGDAQLKDGAWWVEGRTALAPSLSVTLDGALTLSYSSAAISPWNCGNDELHTEGLAAAGVDCEDLQAPPQQEAIAALEVLLADLGVVAELEIEAQSLPEVGITTATAAVLIEGVPTSLAYYLELSSGGIASFSGPMAPLTELGEYPVVSAQEAADRLSDPAFGALAYPVMPLAASGLGLEGEFAGSAPAGSGPADSEAAREDLPLATPVPREGVEALPAPPGWTPPTAPPATPVPGAPLPWPVEVVELVAADLTLTTVWTEGGAVVLVPAYELTSEDGGTWTVLALADSALDMAP
ncbi:hypothetical protein [Serinibacter salmoneus]|uniref:Uncharacterized protein n=1 Tax=Serinibacter salmoneus TaxID=556530 RepID=A0A2A9D1R0_9MICO|nr:hypothetical protein [Serinibacter salmoneus]PFG20627.1 hypothetical protein ATL40_2234 [Serinibacter salmoneus]